MPTLVQGDGEDLLARYRRAREARDVDGVMLLYRDDADLRADPFGDHVTGDLAIRAYWNDMAARQTNVEFDAERAWTSGATVLASWHGAWTVRDTAARVRARGFATFELDDQRLIVRERHWTLERVVGTDATYRPEPPPRGGADG
ncbi:MAG TPA: nuclear transport factor 2 family protein [Candidatus Acidoferrales bacterium]|nr:nuclear transport factor 2 family protein [Candidatus Acidoferrales bacterium]